MRGVKSLTLSPRRRPLLARFLGSLFTFILLSARTHNTLTNFGFRRLSGNGVGTSGMHTLRAGGRSCLARAQRVAAVFSPAGAPELLLLFFSFSK